MQSIKPIYNIEFKRNSRQQFAPTINKNDVNAIVNEFNISNGDMLYLYTADSHNAIQDLQVQYDKLNENMKFIKAGTDDDTKKYKNLYDNLTAKLNKMQKEYDALKSDYDNIKSDKDELIKGLADAQSKYNTIKKSLKELQKQLDDAPDYPAIIDDLEKQLKNAKDDASNVYDDLAKAKRYLFDAEDKRNALLNTINNQNTIINERTEQLNQLKDDYKELQTKHDDKVIELTDKINQEVKSNADKISKLTAGIQYIDDKLSNTNKIIRWIGGLDKAIERIQNIKSIQASAEPKTIDTVKYGVPEDVSDDSK